MANKPVTDASFAKSGNCNAGTLDRAGPLKAIRRHCLSCCNGSGHEVSLCVSTACSLHLLRAGHRPNPTETAAVAGVATHPLEAPAPQSDVAVGSRLKAIRRKCLDCSGYNIAEVRGCRHAACSLHPFRMGKGNRTMSEAQRAAAAERLSQYRTSTTGMRLPTENPAERAVSAR